MGIGDWELGIGDWELGMMESLRSAFLNEQKIGSSYV
jgi:hypothetical protein